MLVPEIMPDEFGAGYMIRLGLCNSLESYAKVTDALQTENKHLDAPLALTAIHLANVLEMDIELFCQQHTLLPIYRSITNTEPDVIHGSLDYPYGIKRFGHLGYLTHFRVCKACVNEDLKSHGFTYFRRSHQLPGICSCSKHLQSEEGQLYNFPKNVFLNPDMAIESLEPVPQYSHPVIDRFCEILDGVCQFNLPTQSNRIVDHLQTQARSKGLRWSVRGRKTLFSDYVEQQLPKPWLSKIVNNIEQNKLGLKFSSLDGVLTPQVVSFKALHYLLAFAVLYDQADEALNILKNSADYIQRQITPVKRLDENNWDKEVAVKIYIKSAGVASTIARIIGASEQSVSKKLREEGMPPLGNYSTNTLQAFILFSKGATIKEALDASSANEKHLEELIRSGSTKLCQLINELFIHHEPLKCKV